MEFDRKVFSSRLIASMTKMRITNKQLERLSGINAGTILRYKRGRTLPNVEIFLLLCKYLEVSPHYLMGWK